MRLIASLKRSKPQCDIKFALPNGQIKTSEVWAVDLKKKRQV